MQLAYGTYATNQSNTELVSAQPGRAIRVVRLLITAWAAMKVTLLSDPGEDPVSLTPPLHVGNGQSLDLRLGRGLALTTGHGKALGLTTLYQVSGAEFSVTVWYEVVT